MPSKSFPIPPSGGRYLVIGSTERTELPCLPEARESPNPAVFEPGSVLHLDMDCSIRYVLLAKPRAMEAYGEAAWAAPALITNPGKERSLLNTKVGWYIVKPGRASGTHLGDPARPYAEVFDD